MKRFAMLSSIGVLWLACGGAGAIEQDQDLGTIVAEPAPVQEAVEDFYISQFAAQLKLNDQQSLQVLPALRKALRQQRNLAAQQTRARMQLQQMLQKGASEEEIQKQMEVIREADVKAQNFEKEFDGAFAQFLTRTQQARLLVVRPRIEQRIRQMIDQARLNNQRRLQQQRPIQNPPARRPQVQPRGSAPGR